MTTFKEGQETIDKFIDMYRRGNIGLDDLVELMNKEYKKIRSGLKK